MKKLFLSLLILTIFAPIGSTTPAINTYDPGLLNSQYMKELKSFEHKKAEEKRQKEKEQQQPQIFILESVNFENNKAFSSETLSLLFENRIGKEVKQQDIINMKRLLTMYYQKNGYTSALVSVSNTKSENKSLTFHIQEGIKNSVLIEVE